MAKRDIILAAIKKGGATKKSLMELAEVNDKGLASQLTYLRMSGHFPVVGEDGVYTLTDAADWEQRRSTSGVGSKPMTPKERLDRAEKRSKRAASAYDNAKIKKEAEGADRLAELNFIKAEAELEISEIMLGQAQATYDALPEDQKEVPVVDDNGNDTDESAVEEETEITDDGIEEEIDDFENDFEEV